MQKPKLSFLEIWNMSFGFVGIQFGFGLQLANMSAIYAKLGAEPSKIPLLWLAGPMTGLLVQPIIGSMSDRTWNRLGRRRPYFTVGAILASTALFFMPDAPALWVAAAMLWVLDASINVSMEPFRAFVADKLPVAQRTSGFVMQSFFIGIGAAVANVLPTVFEHCGVSGQAANGVPLTVVYSFKLGAAAFLGAVLYTAFTTREYPPEDMEEFRRMKRTERTFHFRPVFLLVGALAGALLGASRGALVEHHLTIWHVLAGGGIGAAIGLVLSGPEVSAALVAMPRTMKQLAVVQFFTWLGLFCMWMFFGLATAQQIFGTLDPKSAAFDAGTAFAGQTFAWYSIVCVLAAFILVPISRRTSRKAVHSLALIAGGVCLVASGFIHDRIAWQCTMIGVGIAWASILSMPYAMLSSALPPGRMGVYMGIFNFFIVIPEILASLALEPVVKELFGNDPVKVVMLGGASLLVAAVATQFVKDE
ncbi:MAG: MFS transporter [Chthoniobacteraceae bacterium]